MPQASPTRDDNRGSPMKMDESRNQQSPGMADNQTGQSRNAYTMQEAEEVSFGDETLVEKLQSEVDTSRLARNILESFGKLLNRLKPSTTF
jgi:hypothetical protein